MIELENKWEVAKDMYFSNIPPTDIARELNIDINDLGHKVFGYDKSGNDPECWFQQRKKLDPRAFTHYIKTKGYVLTMAESRLVQKIVESAYTLPDESLNLDDMSKAVEIVSKLDKIGRLEKGEATENIQIDAGFTLRDIQNGKQISEDDVIDAEYREESNGKEKTGEEKDKETGRDGDGRPQLPFFR